MCSSFDCRGEREGGGCETPHSNVLFCFELPQGLCTATSTSEDQGLLGRVVEIWCPRSVQVLMPPPPPARYPCFHVCPTRPPPQITHSLRGKFFHADRIWPSGFQFLPPGLDQSGMDQQDWRLRQLPRSSVAGVGGRLLGGGNTEV